MERLWEKSISLFLQHVITNSPNKEHFIRTLVYSLDHHSHFIGIDANDVISFFQVFRNLTILYKEFPEREGTIGLEELLQSFPAHSPLYVHFEVNRSMAESRPVVSLTEVADILDSWLNQDPSRDILFSLVQNPSPDGMLKLWQIFPS